MRIQNLEVSDRLPVKKAAGSQDLNYCQAFLFTRNTRDFKSEFHFHCR